METQCPAVQHASSISISNIYKEFDIYPNLIPLTYPIIYL
jgi:hypothetical protein